MHCGVFGVNVAGEGVGAQELPRTEHRRAGLLCLGVNWVVLGGRVWCGWHFIFHTADGPGLVFSYSIALLYGQGVNLISEGNVVGEGCLNTPRTPIHPILLFCFFRFSVSLFIRFTLLLFHSFSLSLFLPFSLLRRRSWRTRTHKTTLPEVAGQVDFQLYGRWFGSASTSDIWPRYRGVFRDVSLDMELPGPGGLVLAAQNTGVQKLRTTPLRRHLVRRSR